jgi:2-hydroxy-6-oxo-6-(2'-carboxyphenyl)-hexa-2,4-dienoate hydrolase
MVATTSIPAQVVNGDGLHTRYCDGGSGEPVVRWHGDDLGGASGARTANRNRAGLVRGFRVLAADRLGQGVTDNPQSDVDYTNKRVPAQ